MNSSVTSVSLLHRLRSERQEQDAWQEFVDRYGPRIFEWCRNRRLETTDAQDVTQEILLSLVRQMRTFEYDSTKSFRAWLRRVTENAIVDFVRSKRPEHGKGGSSMISLKNEPARIELVERLAEVFDIELMEEAKSRVQKRVNEKRWLSWHLLTHTNISGKEVAHQLGISVGVAYANKNQVQKLIKSEVESLENGTANQRD